MKHMVDSCQELLDSSVTINAERLWQSLMSMAAIGATPKGGCNRQALTELDMQGRNLFVQWCKEAGCRVRIDAMGNIFARRDGTDNTLPAVITGSHLDTQPTGGKFDGVYGVLAGLEVIRTLNDYNITTQAPVDVIVWTNEEGARFSPAMIGSGVWAGVFDLQYGLSRKDKDGVSIGQALKIIGYDGGEVCEPYPVKAAFEAHIEQGPILEKEARQIGVLSGVQGMKWFDLILEGQPCHAGPTPMEDRKDPFMGLSVIVQNLYEMAKIYSPWSRVTFGDIRAEPGARNTVPERLVLAVDLRHPEQDILEAMEKHFREIVSRVCRQFDLQGTISEEWDSPAVKFDQGCVASVQQAVQMLGYSHMEMVSGAGHDSVYVSRVVPTSMIFVPCEKGLSHNEAENAKPEDLAAGANVLMHAILDQASELI